MTQTLVCFLTGDQKKETTRIGHTLTACTVIILLVGYDRLSSRDTMFVVVTVVVLHQIIHLLCTRISFLISSSYHLCFTHPTLQLLNHIHIHYETIISRLHWRIRNRRRSSRPEDRRGAQRSSKQVRCHIPPIRRCGGRN